MKINYIKFPKVTDDCILVWGENDTHIPFKIQRIYFIKDAETKLPRGFHAHKNTKQVLFCIKGSINLVLDDGKQRRKVFISQDEKGVLIDNLVWHEMHDFKKNTILLVIASEKYDPSDYIRIYSEFRKSVKK